MKMEAKVMTTPTSKKPDKHLRASDIRGIGQLVTQAVAGVTSIVEGVHQSVLSTMGVPNGEAPGQTCGITGLVYKSVHNTTQLLGKGIDRALATLQPLLESAEDAKPGTPQREAVLAILNGIMGDYLVATNNPLATPMTLRYGGKVLNWHALLPMPEATSKVLLLVHGLCMNDLQWNTQHKGQAVSHSQVLARVLGYTPVYLRYNSGLHTSQNGRELSIHLEQLVTQWPTPIEELTIVAYSMGGLLTRSAFYYAKQQDLSWPSYLKSIVFLGTPHHGAPLERVGNWLNTILGSTSYGIPFTKIGKLRSAGITDLRYGNVLDEDWLGHDRFDCKPDNRQPVPLPEGIACYSVAATITQKRTIMAEHLIGDGLVPLYSALGQHDDVRRNLGFAKEARWIAYYVNHMELLSNPEVTQQMVKWLMSAQT